MGLITGREKFEKYLEHIANRFKEELTSAWIVEFRDHHSIYNTYGIEVYRFDMDAVLYIYNPCLNWGFSYKVDQIEQMYEWMTAEEAYRHIREDLNNEYMKLVWKEFSTGKSI